MSSAEAAKGAVDPGQAYNNIIQFLADLRPQIHCFLSEQILPLWLPDGTDEGTKEFYRDLNIPSLWGEPNLLLHRLGITKNPRMVNLFKGDAHR